MTTPADLALGFDAPVSVDDLEASRVVRVSISQLLQEQPFYAAMLMGMNIVTGSAGAAKVKTACVYVSSGLRFGLAVNPEFFDTLTKRQRIGVLMHEVLHLVHYHLYRFKDFKDKQRFNIAADMVINQYIQASDLWIVPQPILPSLFPELNLPNGQTSDYYYRALGGDDGPGEEGEKPPPVGVAAGTVVLTTRGRVPIEQVQIGDHVLVWNFNVDRVFARIVRQVQSGHSDEMGLVLDSSGPVMSCSPGVSLSKGPNDTVAAGELAGDQVLCLAPSQDALAPSSLVYRELEGGGAIYAIEADGLEGNWFAGSIDALVSSSGGGGGGGGGGEGEGDGEGEGEGDGEGDGKGKGKGPPATPDDHDSWGDVDEDGKKILGEILDQMLDELLEKSRDEAVRKGTWGNLPGDLKSTIDERLKAKVDWKKELKKFIGDAVRVGHQYTRKKPHRRFDFDQPGRKPLRSGNVVVIIDTSASVGDLELKQFRAEIDRMSTIADITVIECDTHVRRIYIWNPRLPTWAAVGRGGTSFQPPFDAITAQTQKLLRKLPNGIIYLTDGDAPRPRFDLNIPVLWVYTQEHYVGKQPFGKAIFLDVTQ